MMILDSPRWSSCLCGVSLCSAMSQHPCPRLRHQRFGEQLPFLRASRGRTTAEGGASENRCDITRREGERVRWRSRTTNTTYITETPIIEPLNMYKGSLMHSPCHLPIPSRRWSYAYFPFPSLANTFYNFAVSSLSSPYASTHALMPPVNTLPSLIVTPAASSASW